MSRALVSPAWLGLLPALSWLATTGTFAQDIDEAQDKFIRGNYEQVAAVAQQRVEANAYREDWRRLWIQSLFTLGRYPAANAVAKVGVDDFNGGLELRLLARETALYQNDIAGANQRLLEIKSLIEHRFATFDSVELLVPLGRALLLLGVEPRIVLDNCYRRAENLDHAPRDAFVAAGELALDKHDFALGAETFRAGLKRFPDDPDLEFGLARSFESGDREQMLTAIRAALAVNPRHIPGLLLLADHLIDAEQYGEAQKQLAAVLKINPSQPEALAYEAVLANLRNDPAAEQQYRADALHFWKSNPQVDFLIGLKLSQKYRFEEGAAAQRGALAFDPDYLPAKRQLAEDLLRLGRDAEGWQIARELHNEDNYDVTAYNLVTLHDSMAKFQTLTNADFIVRMSAHEAALYGDRVLSLLDRARTVLCAKYDVELARPTIVDIFPQQRDFAVRTFGMPDNPGYLGVCFGSVITANSPASQAANPANWQDVLWHEFCHVVTLNATSNRMPRWFSEGISVYEEHQADPTWGESMNLAYRRMALGDDLVPIDQLSGAFLTPKDSRHLLFAYYESSQVIEFLVQRFGFNTLKALLADLHQGTNLNLALANRTLPLAELNTQFTRFIRDRASNLAPGVDLDSPPSGDSSDAKVAWEKLHPNNYQVQWRRAQVLVDSRQWAEARPILESLAHQYSGERRVDNPLWLLAITQRNLNATNAEWKTLCSFARIESDFPDLFARLIELSRERKDMAAMTEYADRMLAINPLGTAPYRALADSGVALGRKDQAITAFRKLLLLDPPDPAMVHFQLARLLHNTGNDEFEARRQTLQALEEAPRFRDAQRLLLEIEGRGPNTPLKEAGS